MHLLVGSNNIADATAIKAVGKRKQDKENLKKQIAEENAKASRLTWKWMAVASIDELVRATTLTNNATFVGNSDILDCRDKVEHMTKQV